MMDTEKTRETWVAAPVAPVPRTRREACLVHIYPTGSNMGKRYPLAERDQVIGRSDTCDICIPDNSISRSHVRIEATGDGYRVCDLGSKNGTFVNDQPVLEHCVLGDGDNLRIGNLLFRYLMGGNIEADYHEEIYRLTIQDALTRVHNRRSLTEFLDRELARSERHMRPLSVLLLDIDRFKVINDSHGHLCGDTVLRELAAFVAREVRAEDLFARYGGEEFCMVLVETGVDEARDAADRVRKSVEELPLTFEGKLIPVTVSIGVAATPGGIAVSSAELLRRADEKLYEAKRTGRNRVAV